MFLWLSSHPIHTFIIVGVYRSGISSCPIRSPKFVGQQILNRSYGERLIGSQSNSPTLVANPP